MNGHNEQALAATMPDTEEEWSRLQEDEEPVPVECDECNGEGKFIVMDDDIGAYGIPFRMIVCPECNGTGQILTW